MAQETEDARAGLPPGTLLLSRIKRHIQEEMSRLPDYTCLETAERYTKAGPKSGWKPLDTLRLEVLDSGDKELYAAPNAHGFQRDHPGSFTDTGMTNTGIFALFLRNLLVNGNGICRFGGEEEIDGRRAARYDYKVPLLQSGMHVQLGSSRGVVASKGSFWADLESLDLLRVTIEADDIPPGLPLTSSFSTIDYARMRIGDRSVLLPQTAEEHLVETNGVEARNVIDFTHCQEFHAESAVRFDTPGPPAAPLVIGLPPSEAPAEQIPEGLAVTIALAAEIHGGDPVGTAIEGRVIGNVLLKRAVGVPAGAVVRGRIRRIAPQAVELEFTEIEVAGAPLRFFAELEAVDAPASVDRKAAVLPGVGAISVPAAPFPLPRGFRMVWRTKAL